MEIVVLNVYTLKQLQIPVSVHCIAKPLCNRYTCIPHFRLLIILLLRHLVTLLESCTHTCERLRLFYHKQRRHRHIGLSAKLNETKIKASIVYGNSR